MRKLMLVFWFLMIGSIFGQYQSSYTGAEIDAGVRPYKVYTALLTQSGTDAPVATVLENTIGNIVWSYYGTGFYVGTLTNAFPYAKTCSIPMLSGYYSAVTEGTVTIKLQANINNDSEFLISIIDGTGTEINDALQNHPIEIRVYP